MTPQQIFEVIQGERKYQKARWGEVVEPGNLREELKQVGSWLTLIQHHLSQAAAAWASQPGDEGALHSLRKVMACCQSCFEQHGVPERSLSHPAYSIDWSWNARSGKLTSWDGHEMSMTVSGPALDGSDGS